MGFRCGIVGLPNVGKSTLFNALTRSVIPAENYPFCTIDPNVGIVRVPDHRLDPLARIVQPEKVLPAMMEFVDIAGLVAGAAKGEGLGNKFLGNIRETDAIAHVVRCFEDENVVHVDGDVDPVRDIEVINTELALADLETLEKSTLRVSKLAKSGDKEARARLAVFEKVTAALSEGTPVQAMDLDEQERGLIYELHLLTAKPTLYVANVDEDGFKGNPMVEKVTEFARSHGAEVIAVCAAVEADIAQLEEDEMLEFLHEMGMDEPGLNRVIRAGYDLLGLQTYFTAGEKEVRAWTISKGFTAPKAAAVIHTDFEKGFIRAETIAYDDYVNLGCEQGVKEAGKWRLEGKEYIVADGDVMHFRFNV